MLRHDCIRRRGRGTTTVGMRLARIIVEHEHWKSASIDIRLQVDFYGREERFLLWIRFDWGCDRFHLGTLFKTLCLPPVLDCLQVHTGVVYFKNPRLS